MGSEYSIKSSDKQSQFELDLMASTLAHEIRNPLQILRLQVESAMRGSLASSSINPILKTLERIEKVVEKVQRLSHKHSIQPETHNLQEIVESTVSSFRVWLQAAGIEVSIQTFWEGSPLVQVDRELFEQVILNLVKNSVQAMPKGGRIQVDICECEDAAEIRISDNGKGMSRDVLEAFGTPFFSTQPDGNGLGASFCKSIVSMHRGAISVSSEESKGTEVQIRLPKTFKGN
jgi:signal transduction histidine kinase